MPGGRYGAPARRGQLVGHRSRGFLAVVRDQTEEAPTGPRGERFGHLRLFTHRMLAVDFDAHVRIISAGTDDRSLQVRAPSPRLPFWREIGVLRPKKGHAHGIRLRAPT